MSISASATRIAIAQIPMHWELTDNVASMKRALLTAKDHGAAVCAFSELAVTGFHRRIVEWAKPDVSWPAVDEVRAAAAELGIATAFGAPTYGDGGARYNSHIFVEADGSIVGTVTKIGLTAPEATFFIQGSTRPVINLANIRCSAVICREIEDAQHIIPHLENTGVELLFWPGQMRPDPGKPVQDPPKHVAQAQELARQSSTYIVQTNWPNALNRPEESENTGQSVCIGPTGEILFQLPKQGYGVAVFNLGESVFQWHPSGA